MSRTEDTLLSLRAFCKENKIEKLQKLIDKLKNIKYILTQPLTVTDGYGLSETTTLLCEACEKWSFECVDVLVKNGADVNFATETAATPLQCACRAKVGKSEKVALLLERGADLTKTDNTGQNAVHTASGKGNTVALILLLRALDLKPFSVKSSIINAKSSNGYTPLCSAAASGHEHCIALLKKYGADMTIGNEQGYTPTMIAARWNQASCLVALLRNENCGTWQTQHSNGDTPLHYAVRHNAFEAVQVLVGSGAKLSARNQAGQTPVDLAKPHSKIKEFIEDKTQHTADIIRRFPVREVKLPLKPTPPIPEDALSPGIDESETDGPSQDPNNGILRRRNAQQVRKSERVTSMPTCPPPPPPANTIRLPPAPKAAGGSSKEESDGPQLSDTDTFLKELERSGITSTDPSTLLTGQNTEQYTPERSTDRRYKDTVPHDPFQPTPPVPPRTLRAPTEHPASLLFSGGQYSSGATGGQGTLAMPYGEADQAYPRQSNLNPVEDPQSRSNTMNLHLRSGGSLPSASQATTQPVQNPGNTERDIQDLRQQLDRFKRDLDNMQRTQAMTSDTNNSKQLEIMQGMRGLNEQINEIKSLIRRQPSPTEPISHRNNPFEIPSASPDENRLRDAIQRLTPELSNIDVCPHLRFLFSKSCITIADIERVEAKSASTDKATTLILTLFKKKTNWATAFVESLQNSDEEGDKILAGKIIDESREIQIQNRS